jgi:hypothetical protein
MNYILLIILFYIGSSVSPEPSVSLLPESWVSIDGTSNFDDFSLHYSFEEYSDNMDLAVTLRQQQLIIHPYELSLPIEDFKCKNIFLRHDFRETLKYREQPEILIEIDSMQVGEVDAKQRGIIQAKVQIRGVKREEKIAYQIVGKQDGILNMKGNISIDMTDFELDIERKFLGFIQVEPKVKISFLFNFVVNQ